MVTKKNDLIWRRRMACSEALRFLATIAILINTWKLRRAAGKIRQAMGPIRIPFIAAPVSRTHLFIM